MNSNSCVIPGCGAKARAKGWCDKHHLRWRRYGTPFVGSPYRRARDFIDNVAMQHDSDECLLWPFAQTSDGYGVLGNSTASRVVCERAHGPPFAGADAAHSCDVKLCVNRRHLRWATRQENVDEKRRVYARQGRYSVKLDELF